MKFAGIAAIILSTTSAGFILYDNSRRRLCVFRELVILCDALKRDFMCRRTPINELLGELITTSELRHLNFIKAHSDDGLKAADSPLKKAQNTELNMFLRSLGRSDAETQIDLINSFRDYISSEEERLRNNHTKNARLYLTLGLFCGVVAVLVIV